MKKFLAFILILSSVILFSGCTGENTSSVDSKPSENQSEPGVNETSDSIQKETESETLTEIKEDTKMSAEETVKKYFEYESEKDINGMNSLLTDRKKLDQNAVADVESVRIISCKERSEESDWYEPWYENPYAHTCVDVTYEIVFKDGSMEGQSGTYTWQYYLIKESENSDWLIAEYGVG